MKRIGVSQIDTEYAENSSSNIPRRLSVPTMSDFHDDAEPLWIVRMFNGKSKQTVCAFFGNDSSFSCFENGRVKPVESTNKVGMAHHGFPNPIRIFVSNQSCVNLSQLGNCIRYCWQSITILCNSYRRPIIAEETTNLGHVGIEDLVAWKRIPCTIPSFFPASSKNRSVFPRAGMVPASRTTNLTAELNQWNVQRREHKRPFRF